MRYCIYCGLEINENDKICPNCGENISEDETNKLIKSNVECIKCHSKDVTYHIDKKRKDNIVFEDESFTCNECGKRFTNKNRLGHSFSNNFQLILSNNEKNFIKWLAIIFIIGFLIYIPFIIIDMVVSSTLMSMGMMMLPPTTISAPFKILLFVMADGWNLIIGNLITTFK